MKCLERRPEKKPHRAPAPCRNGSVPEAPPGSCAAARPTGGLDRAARDRLVAARPASAAPAAPGRAIPTDDAGRRAGRLVVEHPGREAAALKSSAEEPQPPDGPEAGDRPLCKARARIPAVEYPECATEALARRNVPLIHLDHPACQVRNSRHRRASLQFRRRPRDPVFEVELGELGAEEVGRIIIRFAEEQLARVSSGTPLLHFASQALSLVPLGYGVSCSAREGFGVNV
jgi:hypothetical protein